MDQKDIERIAQAVMKELGVFSAQLRVAPDTAQPGAFQIDILGTTRGPHRLRIKCGPGSTAQWVRQQIFEQYLAQS